VVVISSAKYPRSEVGAWRDRLKDPILEHYSFEVFGIGEWVCRGSVIL
jgi:hypothetical protein